MSNLLYICLVNQPLLSSSSSSCVIVQDYQEYFAVITKMISLQCVTNSEFHTITNVKVNARHEGVWWSGGMAPPFLTSALDEYEWSASRHAPGSCYIKGWVGPQSRCGFCTERETLLPLTGMEPWFLHHPIRNRST
jgi:hypothetical protein